MKNFYCFIPLENGAEPRERQFKRVFKMNDLDNAKRVAKNLFGERCKMFFFIDFFNRDTWTEITLYPEDEDKVKGKAVKHTG